MRIVWRVAGAGIAVCILAVARPAIPQAGRVTKAQAAAAVALYKRAVEQCAGQGAPCEAAARRQFVDVVSCAAQAPRPVDPATVDQQFPALADLVSAAMDAPGSPGGDPGPCFAGVAPEREEGPTIEALRRFREQAEQQASQPPVIPPPAPDDAFDKLKADVDAVRQRLRLSGPQRTLAPGPLVPGTVPGTTTGAPGTPGVTGAPAVPTGPAVPGTPAGVPVPSAPGSPATLVPPR